MSELDGQKPPDSGGEENYREEVTPFSLVQRMPHNRPPSGDLSVQNLFGNPNLRSQTPPRDFLTRKRKSREPQLGRYLQERRLSVFSNDDKVAIMAHANFLGSDAVDYLQQCEEHVKVLMEEDVSEIDMLNTMEKMLNEMPALRKTARGSTDYSSDAVTKIGTQFLTMHVEDIVTIGVDPEEDLVALQESLQALYVKNINTLEGAAIKENWDQAQRAGQRGSLKGQLCH